jgi:uncharacterized protein YecE (DUF72 family)
MISFPTTPRSLLRSKWTLPSTDAFLLARSTIGRTDSRRLHLLRQSTAVITHEKVLVDCDSEFEEFVKTMDILGPKLGPMVFQFPLFDRWKFSNQDHFLAVLEPLLKKLPTNHKFVIEIRNKTWLDAKFVDVLREYNVALALTDTLFMPRPWEMKEKFDLITADFSYVRWLGDRKGIESRQKPGTNRH